MIFLIVLGFLNADSPVIDKASLNQYLNSLFSLKVNFSQFNPDGSTENGTLWIRKNTKKVLKLQYPEKKILAQGRDVALYQKGQEPQVIDMRHTPAKLLLKNALNFDKDFPKHQFYKITDEDYEISINQDGYNFRLHFNSKPFLRISGWQIIDSQKQLTTVRFDLDSFQQNLTISDEELR